MLVNLENIVEEMCGLIDLIVAMFFVSVRQDESYWPLMPPLPSYGYGRERAGPRYGSLIHGQNLRDVVITGEAIVVTVSS